MDKSNFVIDRVRRVMMFDGSDSAACFNLTQIEGLHLAATVDSTEVTDALGMTIQELQRAKKMEIGGNSSLFDMNLMAAQYGTTVEDSSAVVKFYAPRFETFTYNSTSAATKTLTYPILAAKLGTGIQKYAYKLNKDGSINTRYEYVAATADATHFTMATASDVTTFTPPTAAVNGDVFLIVYEYEADATNTASRVVNKGEAQSANGRLMIECLFRDACTKTDVYYGFVICDNAQIDGNVDINLTTDGKHPFNFKAMPAYCDTDKQLLTFIIPEKETAA